MGGMIIVEEGALRIVGGLVDGRPVAVVQEADDVLFRVSGNSIEDAVAVARARLGAGGGVPCQRAPVDVPVDAAAPTPSAPPRDLRALLRAAVAAFDPLRSEGVTEGPGKDRYRKIYVAGWPALVHYEFLPSHARRHMGVELHVETEKAAAVTGILPALCAGVRDAMPGQAVVHDPNWVGGCGRLQVVFPDTATADTLARAMQQLIVLTRPRVEAALH